VICWLFYALRPQREATLPANFKSLPNGLSYGIEIAGRFC